ncbi:hypothetical protein K7X08_023300 [Anisodus acutangulus]|uniref:M-phase phosphoprotein 6 n=1 Tax=Anisodus acutangulus TaxID=402998 RepID=A0A9Q1LHP0_9SOLA|nr:hypothetical protein K7X08_023300 [Anisodus acutangulus]
MAKRELSSTLRNLKFMQRAALREEKPKKEEEEEEVIPDGNFASSSAPKRCVIIMEGDPHPGAIKGRMSFQGFNPSIDKLSEEASKPRAEGSAACSSETSQVISKRENGTSQFGLENSDLDDSDHDPDKDFKFKQDNTSSEAQYSNKPHKRVLDDPAPSPSSSQRSKKPHRLDWSVLKPPKSQKRRR